MRAWLFVLVVFVVAAGLSVGPSQADPNESVTRSAASASISASQDHTCALLSSGSVQCWGNNYYGGLGDGTTTDRRTPVTVHGITHATAVSVGYDNSCALLADGTVRCWGYNYYGGLGDGTTTNRLLPIAVHGLSGVTAISVGDSSTCALLTGGTVKCWGYNNKGLLGDGTTQDHHTPAPVPGLTGVLAVSVGYEHACALVAGGHLKCWGSNGEGGLGDDSTLPSYTPVLVGNISGATAVAAGDAFTCAVISGAVSCWGYNGEGELGNGTVTDSQTPTEVSGIGGAVTVTAGDNHVCALGAGGTGMACWGYGKVGQLGIGSTDNHHEPVMVPGLTTAVAITAGAYDTCAVLKDGTIRCWGDNEYGELGTGDSELRGDTPATTPSHLPAVKLGGSVLLSATRSSVRLTATHPRRDRTSPYGFSVSGHAVTAGFKPCSGPVTLTLLYRGKPVAQRRTTLRASCTYAGRVVAGRAALNRALPPKLRSRRTPIGLVVRITYGGNVHLEPAVVRVGVRAR
jgi:alpha-tubulin suppressor-like RCC1 family protein